MGNNTTPTVVARHDYLPFGEEIPATNGGRTSQWGPANDQNLPLKVTGQVRDSELSLDWFNTRYHSYPMGRFTTPDPANAGADITNPQSWNGYSYALNNPLSNIDPSGLSCISISTDGNNYDEEGNPIPNFASGDNGDGLGCDAAGVAPGPPNDPITLNQGQINAQVTALNPSDLEYLWTISTNEIPHYDPKDVPLNDYARQVFTRVGRILPTLCGGGAYVYAGKELDAGEVNGFAGGITEFDTREGVSKGALFEGGGGEGIVGGGGYVATTNFKGQVSTSGLGYLGAGAHVGVAGGSAGGVVFANGAGVYAEGSLFGRAAGVGAYVNITTNAACSSGRP